MPTGQEDLPSASQLPSFDRDQGRPDAFGDLGEEGGGLDVGRYLAALRRQRWMILGMGVVGLVVGWGVGRIVRPVYEAQAAVQIPVTVRGASQVTPIRSSPLLDGRGWVELLRSFAVLDEVVRRRRLYLESDTPADSVYLHGFELGQDFVPGEFRLTSTSGRLTLSRVVGAVAQDAVVEEVAPGDSVGRSLGWKWRPTAPPPGGVVDFRVRAPRDAAVLLGGDLVTALPQDGALLRMSLRGEDPRTTAAVLNSVAERFVEVANLLKREKLTVVTDVLREQLESSRVDLGNAESALESFKVNTITLPSDRGATPIASGLAETRDPVRDAFFQLRLDREALVRDREAITRALQPTSDSSRSIVIGLGTISAVRDAAELTATLTLLTERRGEARQLRLAFSSSHPPLQQLEREIDELELRTLPGQALELVENLNLRIGDLDQRIAASSREMQQIPARSTEEARRQRNVDVAQVIYTELQSAYEQARLSELSAAADIRLLDSAVPPTRPVRDQLLFILIGGALAGLALGVGIAILMDRFDRRIRYPDQVTRELGLSILGALPLLTTSRDGKPNAEESAHLLEALRSIRMSLVYAHGTAGTFITTITSPGSGDGKSFLAANLAKSFASSGRRTLLIDADTRRGALHRALGVPRKPGLLDLLSGLAARADVIRSIPAWGIDFLPCGTRMAGAPELLASPSMAQLVLGLRSEYQAIIIDSPPLGAGIDPLVLGSLSGSLVMVLRTGVTDRELAGTRLDDLTRLPIRVLGAVLNDVKPEGVYRYYSYLPGYRSEDEFEKEDAPKRKLLGLG